ncbi:ABC transporter permease [Deinococcus pimensis]|uniref:ABC transporter permease n=1 Tax=Deinococcus pimensis TaxID=309888 RepID=UPI000483E8B8|nr:ABC transporter permease [Deinococcus pimensis]
MSAVNPNNAPTLTVKRRSLRERLRESRPLRKLLRNRLAVFGLFIIAVFVLMAAFAPLIATPKDNCLRDLGMTSSGQVYNPLQPYFWKAIFVPPDSCYTITRISFSPVPTPPSDQAWFGTSQGYDIFYGIVWGARTMLKMGLIIVAINLLIGIIVGVISGYYRGWVDNVIQRVIDIIFAFPGLILTVVLVAIFRPSPTTIILAFVATGWAGYARIIRGDVLRTREMEYVDAARSLGARDARLMFRHVVPNSMTALLTQVVLDLGTVPLGIAALSFLGLGFPVGYTDWGQLINFARAWIQGPSGQPLAYWYVTFFPAICIVLFSLGWNLVGDAARDAFDPRTR